VIALTGKKNLQIRFVPISSDVRSNVTIGEIGLTIEAAPQS
jgi:hypothetical protein